MNIRTCAVKLLFCLAAILLGGFAAKAQYVYKIKADTVRIYNTCDTAELVLQNRTQNVAGYLFNKGQGVTEFRTINWSDIGNIPGGAFAPANIPLSTVLANGNTATNNIQLGATGNTGQYTLQILRNISAVDYSTLLGVGTSGQTVLSGRNLANLANANYISLQPGAVAPVYSPNNGTNTYSIWHTGNDVTGAAFNLSLTGANMLASLTTTPAGRVIGATTRTLLASDIGAAPASNASGYIWAQNAANQASSFRISGTGYFNTPAYTSAIYGNQITANPRSGLNIESNAGITQAMTGPFTTGFAFRWLAHDNAAVNYATDADELMRLRVNGYLGIRAPLPNSFLQVRGSFATTSRTVTASTAMDSTDFTLIVNNTASATITLPQAAAVASRIYTIKKVSGTGKDVIIDPSAGEAIDGAQTLTLTDPLSGIIVQSDGTGWQVVAQTNATNTVNLQQVTTAGNITTNNIIAPGFYSRVNTSTVGSMALTLSNATPTMRWSIGTYNVETGTGNGGADFSIWNYNDAGTNINQPFRIKRSNSAVLLGGTLNINTIPAAATAKNILVDSAGQVQSRTPAQVLSDIGAASASGSGNYIQNQTSLSQAAGFKISQNSSIIGSTPSNTIFGIGNSNTGSAFFVLDGVDGTLGAVHSTRLYQENSGRFVVQNNGGKIAFNTQNVDRITIDSSGNLGVGTATPSARFAFGISDVIAEIGRIGFDVGVNQRAYIAANRHTANGQLTDLTMGTMGVEVMRLNSAGNVGIGTATPARRLDVAGTFGATGAATLGSTLSVSGAVSTGSTLDIGSTPALATAATNYLTQNAGVVQTRTPAQVLSDIGAAASTGSTNYIQNQTASTQGGAFKLNASSSIVAPGSVNFNVGQTGTGTDNVAGIALDAIDGNFTGLDYLQLFQVHGTGSAFLRNNNPTGSLILGTNQTDRLTILSNGSIGIGNAAPFYTLDVSGSVRSTVALVVSNGSNVWSTHTDASNNYSIDQSGTSNRLTVLGANGNIGIGNTNPTQKLDVAGTFGATGAATLGSTLSVSGAVSTGSTLDIGSTPALATVATNYLTQNAGVVQTRTPAQVLSDIGAAAATGSVNYIQNQNTSAQTANFWVAGQASVTRINTSNTAGNAHWALFNGSNAAANLRWSSYLINTEATGNVGSDWRFDRYDNTATDMGVALLLQRSTGNLGIGTTNPAAKLDVAGTANISGNVTTGGTLDLGTVAALGTAATTYLTHTAGLIQSRTSAQVLSDIGASPAAGSGNYVQNQTAADQSGSYRITGEGRAQTFNATSTSAAGAALSMQSSTNSRFWIVANDVLRIGAVSQTGVAPLNINNSGNIGIGINTPTTGFKLDVVGNIQATGFYQASLRSLKKNIQPFTDSALQILNSAQVRTFEYKADSSNIKHIGFIADEVPDEMAAPGHKGVDETSTVALLVKAMQEMKASMDQQVTDLKKQVADLQQQLKEVKAK